MKKVIFATTNLFRLAAEITKHYSTQSSVLLTGLAVYFTGPVETAAGLTLTCWSLAAKSLTLSQEAFWKKAQTCCFAATTLLAAGNLMTMQIAHTKARDHLHRQILAGNLSASTPVRTTNLFTGWHIGNSNELMLGWASCSDPEKTLLGIATINALSNARPHQATFVQDLLPNGAKRWTRLNSRPNDCAPISTSP